MNLASNQAVYFWGFLLLYGTVMYLTSPKIQTVGGFFYGTDDQGRAAARWSLTTSVFISWIFAKSFAREIPALAGRLSRRDTLRTGAWVMVTFAVLGNLPMLAGTDILKATTISETMVMGLAPVFLLQRWIRYSPWSFHLSFWPGIALATLLAAGWISASWSIGDGKYGLLLATNAYGLALCTLGFLLPVARDFELPEGKGVIMNNGTAGLPAFSNTCYGLITRISTHPPEATESVYGTLVDGIYIDALPLRYDDTAWRQAFLTNWPPGSPPFESYFRRISHGPSHTPAQAVSGGIVTK